VSKEFSSGCITKIGLHTTKIFAKARLDDVTSGMQAAATVELYIKFSALVHNFNDVFK